MNYTNPQHVISTMDLADRLSVSNLRVFDVTVHLVPKPPGYQAISGEEDYSKEHIPGAAFLNLGRDFSDTSTGLGFSMPSADYLQSAWRKAGINDDSQVIFYSTGHMMWATRAWWMLRSCGHKNVAVLDGSFDRWQQEDRPTSSDSSSYSSGDMTVDLNSNYWVDKEATKSAIGNDAVCTINALAPDVYSGSASFHYGRKGHIENSKNFYYANMLDDGCFKSAADLHAIFSAQGVLEKDQVIAYCGGGISATIDAMALALIGYEKVAVYDGSMGEWVKDETLPLILGE